MKIENLQEAIRLSDKIKEARHELSTISDALANASGTLTVKINTRWILNLPAQAILGHLQSRKAQLEQDIIDAENTATSLSVPDEKKPRSVPLPTE